MKLLLIILLLLTLFSCADNNIQEDCFDQCKQYLDKKNNDSNTNAIAFMQCIQECQIAKQK